MPSQRTSLRGPNRYGRMAEEHMRRWAPERLAQIPDPTAYFTDLGEQVEAEIEVRTAAAWTSISSQDLPYAERRGRMNMTRLTVTEEVMSELALLAPESDPDDALRDETGAFIGADPAMGPWTPLFPPEDPED